ncbi:succinate dehydrogenase cytochrome b560 subunit, mitochondrial-like [Myxocyprinus asiaticus]|uniref:succinate dehydrogenase cytochrome b560 subunit, mitochondrial-like n=1 Tax=Myxocyprinus asiaticus TaxID=70543 RepID=UPI00222196C4|nr:succinate dehydrogenase cytochrome b560 subunit, mitochondrial-like [Myxocyprinus asiaticus]
MSLFHCFNCEWVFVFTSYCLIDLISKFLCFLLRMVAQQCLHSSRSQFGVLYRHDVSMRTTAKVEMDKFWTKNTRLNQPVSPVMVFCRWSVPMMRSTSHRGTRVAISGGISAFALVTLVLPESYPHYLDLIHSMSFGPQFLALSKIALSFPVAYHTFNMCGVGKGSKIPEVYRSGYVVIALTVLTSVTLAAM